MTTEDIKALFTAMKESEVLFFKHTLATGESVKVVMKTPPEVETTDVRGVGFNPFPDQRDDGEDVVEDIYRNKTLKLVGFNSNR